jgi:hypothetical protein
MQRYVGQLRVPVYILHSRDDHVIPIKVRSQGGVVLAAGGGGYAAVQVYAVAILPSPGPSHVESVGVVTGDCSRWALAITVRTWSP